MAPTNGHKEPQEEQLDRAPTNGHKEPQEAQLDRGLTLNLVMNGLGAGMLSMPWTQAGTGILNGLLWTLLVLVVTHFTMMLLVRAGEQAQCWTFEDLIERAAPGSARVKKLWAVSCTAAICWSNFLPLVGYMIIIGDSVTPTLGVLGLFAGSSFSEAQVRQLILLIAQICIFPLCFLNQRQLEYTSALGTFSNCFIVFAVFLNFFVEVDELESSQGVESSQVCMISTITSGGNLTCLSNLMMAITFQACVLPMYREMNTDPADTSRPLRTPRNFGRALKLSFVILYVLFSSFMIVGFASFGPATQSNVLNNLPTKKWYTCVARLCMVGVCLGIYPLMLYPMVAPLAKSRQSTGKAVLNASSLAVALFVTDLGVVNVVNGAVGIFFLVGLYPAVVALGILNQTAAPHELEKGTPAHANGDSKPSCWYSAPVMVCLVVSCFMAMLLGLSHTQNEADQLSKHCLLVA